MLRSHASLLGPCGRGPLQPAERRQRLRHGLRPLRQRQRRRRRRRGTGRRELDLVAPGGSAAHGKGERRGEEPGKRRSGSCAFR